MKVSRTGYWKDKATQPPPRFGEVGKRLVEYAGELPFEHRGAATSTLYVWTARHPRLFVDARDLPALGEAAGRDQLRSPQGPLGLEADEPEPEDGEELTEEVSDDSSDDGAGQDA